MHKIKVLQEGHNTLENLSRKSEKTFHSDFVKSTRKIFYLLP